MASCRRLPPTKSTRRGEGDVQRILEAVRRVVRELRLSGRRAEDAVGLSGAQLFVLQRLGDGACASLAELAARTMTDPSSVSVVVQRLVARGLVRRAPSAADARRRELALTARGRAVLGRAPELAQDRLIAALGGMSARDRGALSRGLDRMVTAMGVDGSGPAALFFESDTAAARKKRSRGR